MRKNRIFTPENHEHMAMDSMDLRGEAVVTSPWFRIEQKREDGIYGTGNGKSLLIIRDFMVS